MSRGSTIAFLIAIFCFYFGFKHGFKSYKEQKLFKLTRNEKIILIGSILWLAGCSFGFLYF
jgi:hypothetical protein